MNLLITDEFIERTSKEKNIDLDGEKTERMMNSRTCPKNADQYFFCPVRQLEKITAIYSSIYLIGCTIMTPQKTWLVCAGKWESNSHHTIIKDYFRTLY